MADTPVQLLSSNDQRDALEIAASLSGVRISWRRIYGLFMRCMLSGKTPSAET